MIDPNEYFYGFCMSPFDTNTCGDCPSLRECAELYGTEQVSKLIKETITNTKGADNGDTRL
jgi:hypothetical protein